MSDKSKIEWTEATWNPIAGCTKCSPGCANCYAERMAKRISSIEEKAGRSPKYGSVVDNEGWMGNIICDSTSLDIPSKWRKPRRIFVCSMSDLFHPKVPLCFIGDIHEKIIDCPQHTFLILTKRIDEAAQYYETCSHKIDMPFKNIHLGVSISNADEMWKAKVLADIPVAVRYISFEPLLEDIIDIPLDVMEKMDWAIIGCESGPKRREFDNSWALGLVADFHHFNKPVFVKQININGKVVKMPKEYPQEYPEGR